MLRLCLIRESTAIGQWKLASLAVGADHARHYLANALAPGQKINQKGLAPALGVHCNTLAAYLTLYGIPYNLSGLDDDGLIREYRKLRPDAGLRDM